MATTVPSTGPTGEPTGGSHGGNQTSGEPEAPKPPQWFFPVQPWTFIGVPQNCVGFVPMRNDGDSKGRPGRMNVQLCEPEIPVIKSAKAFTPPATIDNTCLTLRVAEALCPGEERPAQAVLTLDPATPPGDYNATLCGDGCDQRPITIKVLEYHRVQILPNLIEQRVDFGATVRMTFWVRNDGNVPEEIPKRVVVRFQPKHGVSHYIHSASKEHGGDGYESVLSDIAKRMGDDEPTPGRAKITAGFGPLAPLESRLVTLEITSPKKLEQDRTHRARIVLVSASLRLILHVGPDSGPIS